MSIEFKKVLPLVLAAGTAIAAGLSHGDALSLVQAKPGQDKGIEHFLPQGAPSEQAYQELVNIRTLSLDISRNNLAAVVVQDAADHGLQSYIGIGTFNQAGDLQFLQAGRLPESSYPIGAKWVDTTPVSLIAWGQNIADPYIYQADRGRIWITSDGGLSWRETKMGFDLLNLQLAGSSFAIARETDPKNRSLNLYKKLDLQTGRVTTLNYCPCPLIIPDTELQMASDGSYRGFARYKDQSGYVTFRVSGDNLILTGYLTGRGTLGRDLVRKVEGDREVVFTSAASRVYRDEFIEGRLVQTSFVEPNRALYGGQMPGLTAYLEDRYLATNITFKIGNLPYVTSFIEQTKPNKFLTDQGVSFRQTGQDVIRVYPMRTIKVNNQERLVAGQTVDRYSGNWMYPAAGQIADLDLVENHHWQLAAVKRLLYQPVATPTPVLTPRQFLAFTPRG